MKDIATKKPSKKITLNRESLRTLTSGDLESAAGGINPPVTWYCSRKATCS